MERWLIILYLCSLLGRFCLPFEKYRSFSVIFPQYKDIKQFCVFLYNGSSSIYVFLFCINLKFFLFLSLLFISLTYSSVTFLYSSGKSFCMISSCTSTGFSVSAYKLFTFSHSYSVIVLNWSVPCPLIAFYIYFDSLVLETHCFVDIFCCSPSWNF